MGTGLVGGGGARVSDFSGGGGLGGVGVDGWTDEQALKARSKSFPESIWSAVPFANTSDSNNNSFRPISQYRKPIPEKKMHTTFQGYSPI